MPAYFRPSGALTFVVAGSLLLTLGLAVPASADDYPTWDDVLAAQGNEAATAQEIDRIEGLLVQLESDAAALGRTAQLRAEEYNAAQDALAAASSKAEKLQTQLAVAEKRAEESSAKAGQLLAQLARTGGGNVSLSLVFAGDSSDLLSTLGTVGKVGEQAELVYRNATVDANQARTLGDQAAIAEQKRTTLAADAESALAAATEAADAAQAQVAEQKSAADQMYSQLASLKGTTADVESRYQAGLTAAAEEAAQPPPPPAPAPTEQPNPTPPPPNSSAVQTALAFAYAQVGDMYQLSGSGPDVWDCSGLTKASYAAAGVYIGAHVVSSQYYTMAGQSRLVPIGQMVAGDLIFYANGGSTSGGFYHVAMYVGNGQMIEAPREGIPVRIVNVRYYDALPYAGRPTP